MSSHDEMLEEPRREHHEELEAWVRGLCVSLTPAASDNCSGGGIGEALLEITDSTEPIVLSICGRDRRLHVH